MRCNSFGGNMKKRKTAFCPAREFIVTVFFILASVFAECKKDNTIVVLYSIDYNGSKENAVNKTRLYSIDKYGSKSVAFIGVTIPFNITSSSPKSFMDQE